MKYTQPLNDRSLAIVVVTAVMLGVAVIAVILRCFVRLYMLRAFGWDDGLMVAALVVFLAFGLDFALGAMVGIGHKLVDFQSFSMQSGNPQDTIQALQQAMMIWWLAQMFFVWSAAIAKVSISLALLRIAVGRVYRGILWGVIGAVVTITLVFWFVLLLSCRPISYFWGQIDPATTGGTCLAPNAILVFAYCYSALCMISDLTLGILPAVLIWDLQMSPRTKVALCAILGLGAIASVAVVIRMPYLKYYTDTEFLYSTYLMIIWSVVETGSAITAGSLITLKPLFRWLVDGSTSSRSYRVNKPSYKCREGRYALSILAPKTPGNKDEPKDWRPVLISEDSETMVGTGTTSVFKTVGAVDSETRTQSSQERLTKDPEELQHKNQVTVHQTFWTSAEDRG
ncbi:uncharacterized protein DSM5745_01016 [Aspergillus mulundensis]|uniref:Rhodopsin domain-containing protein n=1 Tax=Aspergillus mulundensis TaxID=1810919 RepID=A0A3D8T598_9EURO|nr:Uncharacterized protein DSM5745_01016 [Aspergillus mulundensis]RDW93694.1 Uncharacterized protein DSM5745_01016 [Aspergillus mulundensis]